MRTTLRHRLSSFADHRFSESAATEFAHWCRQTRRQLAEEHNGDSALTVLAESYTASALLRRESSGYFYRADFPTADPAPTGLRTVARYNQADDAVSVELVANASKAPTSVMS
ncbi:hypothetical protein [Nocardia australiensis]|uniref:hypothetical protein n=1 Tax=Nocardia australiensis TaxID=2887191 RepID=UPI001D15A8B6|nr:hypothetical protein [Nocardia australiensis]